MKKTPKDNFKLSEFEEGSGGATTLEAAPGAEIPFDEGEEIDLSGQGAANISDDLPEPAPSLAPLSGVVETAELKLSEIVVDGETQPRVAIDTETIKEYAEVVREAIVSGKPIPFPPITVFRDVQGRCVLADGFHRFGGHREGGADKIEAEIHDGTSEDALRFSLSANTTHGVRRTNKDKQRAVKIALAHPIWQKLSDSAIARMCEVSPTMVSTLRPANQAASPIRQVTRRDGRTVAMDTSAIGKGKGGGKKAQKAKAAASKKASKTATKAAKVEDTTATKPSEDSAAKLDKALGKIADGCGAEGGKFRKAVNEGALPHVTFKDVEYMNSLDASMQKKVLPLVMGGQRMKPAKAYEFVRSELSAKVQEELHNRAIAGGGKFDFEGDGFKISVRLVSKASETK